MRKAAGIILITLGVLFLCGLIYILVVLGIKFGIRHLLIPAPDFVFFLGLVAAAFHITGGIFCLRRKYWRVCLASASFAVSLSVFFLVLYLFFVLVMSPFRWGLSWSDYIPLDLPIWVMLVAKVISVIFIVRRKKEWQETSDIMDSKASNDG